MIVALTGLLLAGGVSTGNAKNSKYASIVVDVRSGQVLYARGADVRRYPASLTKIMTLYMVFQALDGKRLALDTRIPISKHAAQQPPSKLRLKVGDSIALEDAILALVTKSANDVAVAIAEHLGGSEARFAQKMTLQARRLGMNHTHFRNASGLPDRAQYTTARDMSVLARAMLRDFPQYYPYFSEESFVYKGREYRNHNHLLGKFPGTDGIKTGYIDASGYNLVASVSREGRRLVGVVFGGRTAARRDANMRTIIDRSFERLVKYTPRPVAPIPAFKPADGLVGMIPASDWRVQVGAFETYDVARDRAKLAAQMVSGFLKSPHYAVIPGGGESEQLYRAQLTPQDARKAALACEVLRQRQVACFTIPPTVAVSTSEG